MPDGRQLWSRRRQRERTHCWQAAAPNARCAFVSNHFLHRYPYSGRHIANMSGYLRLNPLSTTATSSSCSPIRSSSTPAIGNLGGSAQVFAELNQGSGDEPHQGRYAFVARSAIGRDPDIIGVCDPSAPTCDVRRAYYEKYTG
jgi:hypothetical protein